MLFRRTLKLVEFDTASKNAEKAKPPKKNWVRTESSAYRKCFVFSCEKYQPKAFIYR